MPTHFPPLTRAYGPGTPLRHLSVLESFHPMQARFLHSLSDPFAVPLSTGFPPSPALCRRASRFDLRLIGFCIHCGL